MMKKILLSALSFLFPILSFASSSASGSSFSFAPPPSDVSVVFLGNIFGIVDGVLHGTGSQIMGTMFGMFNSCAQAIGGAVIMYTLIVSTMNTAQEGQMLGQKWSSIWVPVRSTLGIALLTPKASGYCLLQIFVMWIVLQGVGAADKVWGAALSYLNRGGTLVQSQMTPQVSLRAANSSVAEGAAKILQGQVCMAGLQTVLQNTLQTYQAANKGNSPAGECISGASDEMLKFCNAGQVPDFLSTVNVVSVQNASPDSTANYSVPMPNFDRSSTFFGLNGICGTLSWSPFKASDVNSIQKKLPSVNSAEIQTAKLSRAIAIQQMYSDLATVARLMVANNPSLNRSVQSTGQRKVSDVAVQQFGIPLLSSGSPCTGASNDCISWGKDGSSDSAPLLSGIEFQGAIADYNGIMLPTINLLQQARSEDNKDKERSFIKQANAQGWLLAGSYFFNLSMLNAAAINNANLTDSNTGLESSEFDTKNLLAPFGSGGCTGSVLCDWRVSVKDINKIVALINGSGLLPAPMPPPSVNPMNNRVITGTAASTTVGFINNSVMVNLPGQSGMQAPKFVIQFNFPINLGQYQLPWQDFPCSGFLCLSGLLGDLFYNLIFRSMVNTFISVLAPFITVIIQTILVGPLLAISQMFSVNLAIIQQPKVNPIVALANMGVNYINFSSDLWIVILGLAANPITFIIFPLIALALPLLVSWIGVMVAIGFTTAYYIPFVPYMIFTFGSIAWLMAVIEAMVAAPIVALGIMHPEGHEAFGKGEQALMILMNVFLRPALMIIGYIAAIGLSYVSVWIINAGFANAAAFIQGTATSTQFNYSFSKENLDYMQSSAQAAKHAESIANSFNSMKSGYTGWAGVYGFFFCSLIYTTMYLVAVQKAFTLITYLPDKVLRWIGGQPEGIGEQAAQWAEQEPKKQIESAGTSTAKAASRRDQEMQGYAQEKLAQLNQATKRDKTKIQGQGESGGGGGEMPGGGGGEMPPMPPVG